MMQQRTARLDSWSSRAICSAVASVFFVASTSQAVPIDLTDATPTVTGATTLNFSGIAAVGSMWWADFEWNENGMNFDLMAYGQETSSTLSHGLDGACFEAGLLDFGPSS